MEERLLLSGSACPPAPAAHQCTGACPRLRAPVGTQHWDGVCEGLLGLLGETHRAAETAPWGCNSNPQVLFPALPCICVCLACDFCPFLLSCHALSFIVLIYLIKPLRQSPSPSV